MLLIISFFLIDDKKSLIRYIFIQLMIFYKMQQQQHRYVFLSLIDILLENVTTAITINI